MTIEWYIKNVLVKDLGKMVFTPGLQYLSFGVMGSMIEFLGAFFDYEDFHKQGLSQKRFSKAIQSLTAFSEYRKFDDSQNPHDLYSNMRCGMAHIGRPNVGVAFTERGNPKEWDKHLQVCNVNDPPNHPQRLILVCEDLYFDITNGANELLIRMKAKDSSIKRKGLRKKSEGKIATLPIWTERIVTSRFRKSPRRDSAILCDASHWI